MSDQSPIRVYVACLASYNTGILHGAWIDATQGENHLRKATQDMLKRSPMSNAEEWAIHDHEGLPNASVQEHSSFTKIAGLASFMEDHGRLGEAILAYYSGSLDDARDALTERYQGQFESLADFAQDVTEGTTNIPESLQYYIDYEKMAADMTLSGDVFGIELGWDEVHVFYS